MSYDPNQLLTYCGITAPASLWAANGFRTSSTGEPGSEFVSGGPYNHEAELAAARLAAGADDWRALATLKAEHDRRSEEQARCTAITRLAAALDKVAETGKESAVNDIIGQLSERTQFAVRQQLRR